ncbi:MAG: hypothetical protein RLY49_406 [Candidatus Parcubacteria bacterium]|jgi:prepilin-type N-terminal cleavage/methylation domain-containing protein
MNIKTKGFTLIELLVVIAIIGILSSVVLASLNSARNKGADAAVKANLNGIRAQAELLYDDEGDYDNLCTNTTIVAAIDSAKSAAGDSDATGTAYATAQAANNSACHVGGTPQAWAISVPIKSVTGTYWCVDSAGKAIQTTTVLSASDATCD